METKLTKDIGEEVIAKLKELNLFFKTKYLEEKNANECATPFSSK